MKTAGYGYSGAAIFVIDIFNFLLGCIMITAKMEFIIFWRCFYVWTSSSNKLGTVRISSLLDHLHRRILCYHKKLA